MSKKITLLVTSPSFPAKTFVDFVVYAKANPGKVNYGTLGAGGTSHLIGAWLEIAANIKVTFIPYKGTGPQLLDIATGRLDVTQSALSAVAPFIKSGKVRPLVSTDDRRSTLLPDLPTIAEHLPGVGYQNWTGFFAPRATPAAAVSKLSELFARVAKEADILSAAKAQGNIMVGSSPSQFAQIVLEDVSRWQKLAQAIGIVLEE